MRSSTLVTMIALTLAGGCAYKSSYRQTNFDVTPRPVASKSVKVAKGADEAGGFVQLGTYRGRAPTEKEVVEAAKVECGRNGADLVVYSSGPKSAGDSFELDAICGIRGSGKGKKVRS